MRATVTICVVLICVSISEAQETKETLAREQSVVVPRNIALPAIASQPECPLEFENSVFVAHLKGGGGETFRLRNRGNKPIRKFTIAAVTSNGTGWQTDWPTNHSSVLVMPGDLAPSGFEINQLQIEPLNDSFKKKRKLDGPMMAVSVLIVVRVEFSDGTIYDDSATFKALEAYFNDLAMKTDRRCHTPTSP